MSTVGSESGTDSLSSVAARRLRLSRNRDSNAKRLTLSDGVTSSFRSRIEPSCARHGRAIFLASSTRAMSRSFMRTVKSDSRHFNATEVFALGMSPTTKGFRRLSSQSPISASEGIRRMDVPRFLPEVVIFSRLTWSCGRWIELPRMLAMRRERGRHRLESVWKLRTVSGHMGISASLIRSGLPMLCSLCRNHSQNSLRVCSSAYCSFPLARNVAIVYFWIRHFLFRKSGCDIKSRCRIDGKSKPGTFAGRLAPAYKLSNRDDFLLLSGSSSVLRNTDSFFSSHSPCSVDSLIMSRYARAIIGCENSCAGFRHVAKY